MPVGRKKEKKKISYRAVVVLRCSINGDGASEQFLRPRGRDVLFLLLLQQPFSKEKKILSRSDGQLGLAGSGESRVGTEILTHGTNRAPDPKREVGLLLDLPGPKYSGHDG